MIKAARLETVVEEFAGADLGDQRRSQRLTVIAGVLDCDPASGFPGAMGSTAALEAFYRFINNDGFTAQEIVAPHIAATLKRAEDMQVVIAVHDTTAVEYDGERNGLGVTTGKGRYGFVAHVSLVLSEENGLPLGVAHLETLTRSGKKWAKRKKQGQRTRVHCHDEGRESLRWIRGVKTIENARQGRFEVIHVTDAEGDFFELLAALNAMGGRFVIRAGQLDRGVVSNGTKSSLRDVADQITPVVFREIELSERRYPPKVGSASKRRRHPERAARRAQVAIGCERITVKKTKYSDVKSDLFQVNVVRVWEPRPEPGEPAVEWILLTNEDTSTAQALERVVDIYRRRWTIEDYFKALKTGCSLEKRQVESYDALCKVLALFVPIAYRLLLLRGLERLNSRAPAILAFSPTELHIMAHAPANGGLKPARTVGDALLHLARLGGHIKNNGPPGWQTLGRGYEKLMALRLGWEMALASKSDQS